MKPSPRSIYEQCTNFEEQAAEIYMRMASHFCPGDQELSFLWLELGMQEKEHAGLLQFCIAEELFVRDLPSEADIQNIESLFASLRRRAADPDLTAGEAFEIATELETSEVNAIYCTLTTPVHGSMYLLRRKIMTSMPDHVERLAREGRKHGVPEATLQRLTGVHEKCPE
jgi:hypothetical protein